MKTPVLLLVAAILTICSGCTDPEPTPVPVVVGYDQFGAPVYGYVY